MYFQFLIEDDSTRILVDRVMEKVKSLYFCDYVFCIAVKEMEA